MALERRRAIILNNHRRDVKYLFVTEYPNGDVNQWSYDDIGNRVQQIVKPVGQGAIVTDYTYYQNAQGKNSQLLQSDGISTYTWDNNGNLLTKGSTNYTWDYDDRLVGISSPTVNASYVYDYLGNRVRKTADGSESIYLYNSEDIVKETKGVIDTNYLHGIGIDEPVMMDRGGAKNYYFRDGVGSIREMTDSGGIVQNSYEYGAWGQIRNQTQLLNNIYGYTGREFSEDGLHFYRARYLELNIGKFISRDPLRTFRGENRYIYVENNPIYRIDPFGMAWKPPEPTPPSAIDIKELLDPMRMELQPPGTYIESDKFCPIPCIPYFHHGAYWSCIMHSISKPKTYGPLLACLGITGGAKRALKRGLLKFLAKPFAVVCGAVLGFKLGKKCEEYAIFCDKEGAGPMPF